MFIKQSFPLEQTHLFDQLMLDYVSGSDDLKPFYAYPFSQKGFDAITAQNSFASVNRAVLTAELKKQAASVDNTSALSLANIELLQKETTYTVTTGHQLCLFTGPLYFVYKIISVINLCETMKKVHPAFDFVPVYWMASEDHDFAEINHAHLFGKTITWNTEQAGSVGEFKMKDIQPAIDELKQVLGNSEHAGEWMAMIEKAYLKHDTLADATRSLVNELFKSYGLVVLDANAKALKELFKPELEKDLFENAAYKTVTDTNKELEKKYKIQVNPREINVFYKDTQLRGRFVNENGAFKVLNTDHAFSEAEVKEMLEKDTDKLSPNVVLRPLYQQKILPNIAYVGGPGELAYWMEYKSMFDAFKVQFPVLVPRQFVALLDKGTEGKLQKLKLDASAIFKSTDDLVSDFIKNENGALNLDSSRKNIEDLYQQLLSDVMQIDKSLQGAVDAEKQKALNGLAAVEQKLNRALKQRSETDLNQIKGIKAKLFPDNTPHERYDNIGMYYSKYGQQLIVSLKEYLNYTLGNFEYIVLRENA